MPRPAAPAPTLSGSSFGLAPRGALTAPLTLVGWSLLLLVTLAHPSATRVHTWPWALLGWALWLFPVVAAVVSWLRPDPARSWRFPGPLVSAGLALLAIGTVSGAFFSPFAGFSVPRLWPTLGGIAWLLLAYHAFAGPTGPTALHARGARLLALTGAVLLTFSAVRGLQLSWPAPWAHRNAVPFGHSTYTAAAVVIFLPWLAWRVWETRGKARLLWSLLLLLGLGVLVSTSSRGGVLGVGAAASVPLIALWLSPRVSRRQKFAVLLLAGAALITVVTANPRLRELVLERRWGETARESNEQRRAMLDAAALLGRERPWVGWGPGTVPLAYPHVRAQLDGGVENVLQVHSSPAQLWAENGLVGVAAVGLVLVGLLATLRRIRPGSIALTAGSSLLGFAAFCWTDHALDLPVINFGVGTSLALLLASAPAGRESAHRRPRLIAGALALLVLALCLPGTVRDLRARRAFDQALTALGEGQTDRMLAALDAASRRTPHDSFFDHFAAAHLWSNVPAGLDAGQRAARLEQAVARLQRSLVTGAHEEFAAFNLGWLLLERGDPAGAARNFRLAAARVPDKGGVYFGLGLALRALGRSPEAARAFALEWINDPRSFTSPAWELPALAAEREAIAEEARRLLRTIEQQQPSLRPEAAWLRWWWGEAASAEPPAAIHGATRAWIAAWPRLRAKAPVGEAGAPPWSAVYEAWRSGDSASAWERVTRDPEFAAALAARAQKHAADFRQFLTAPLGEHPALARAYHRTRPGYGVLATHPEGPPLTDAYVVQESRVMDFAADLLPRKGWVPGRFLLALLPPESR